MGQNRTGLVLQRIGLLALLVAMLAGCGKEAPPPRPPAPPRPPPFQSQAVEVELGEDSGSITLMTTESGGYTRDGNAFASGDEVEAENGNKYKLTLGEDGWSAEFLPAEGVAVALGTSGEAVLITEQEDGTYLANDKRLVSGGVVEASNGNRYRLTLGEDGWSPVFEPTLVSVDLGQSGGSVTLRREEDGQYWLGSIVIEDGHVVEGPNDSTYELTLRDGVWTAAFRPATVQVPAGESGEILDLARLEDGTYWFRGKQIRSGDTVEAENGNTYTLSLDSETGTWQAVFDAGTISVPLGSSGDSVQLTKLEDGTYARSGRTFRTGSLVEANNGVRYRLTLTEDGWRATAHSVVEPDPGGGSGGGTTTKRSDNLESVQSLPSGRDPTFRTSDGDPDPDEGTTLVVKGTSDATPQEYELQDLLRRGLVTRMRTYVEAARDEIRQIRDAIHNRRQIYDLEGLDPHEDIAGQDGYWSQVQAALLTVFGDADEANNFLGDLPTGRRDETLDADEVDDVIEALDEALDSLSTLSKFEDDVFDRVDTTASVEDVYEAPISKIQFGSSSNTRFAAYGVQHTGGSAVAPETWDVGAFAYSPLEVSNRTKIPNRGEASFRGDTAAVEASLQTTGTPKFYSGDIELTARFSTGRVLALITNLRDEDNDLWTYNGDEVESIRLPIATLGSGDAEFSVSGTSTADLRFVAGTQPNSTLQGKFVGDDEDEADAVIGTWDIDGVSGVQGKLTGAFGAEYRTTRRAEKPELEESPRGSRSETAIDIAGAPDADGKIDLGSFEDLDASRLYSDRDGRSVIESTDDGVTLSVSLGADETLELTVEYRRTDYTRFGVWVQEKTLADDSVDNVRPKGVFAYSPLGSTVFDPALESDFVYPRNVTAVYSGQTIALDTADDPETYTGSFELTVNWNGSASAAELEAVIRDLRSLNDRDWFAVDGEDVDRILLTGAVSMSSTANGVSFDSTPSFEVWFRDPSLARSTLGGSHAGKFLGRTIDGPVAVIGKWGISNRIEGVYGAELQP